MVLDMRDMDSVQMMLPKTYLDRKFTNVTTVDVPMEDLKGPLQSTKKTRCSKEQRRDEEGSSAIVLGASHVAHIDARYRTEEYIAGDKVALNDEGKRRRESDDEVMDAMPRTKSGESGAEADSERSSGRGSREDSSDEVSSGRQTSQGTTNHEDSNLQKFSKNAATEKNGHSSRERTTNWVDRSIDENVSGTSSGSNSNMSRSGTSNFTSADAESDEKDTRGDQQMTASLPSPDWDPHSSFEHKRWQRHHRPPGAAAADRVQLPSTGGFFWSSDQADITQASSTGMMDTKEPVYLGGASWDDLHTSDYKSAHMVDSVQHTLGDTNVGEFGYTASIPSDQSKSNLQAGIHRDRYSLVELGPGVGIRSLDIFSDRAGRLSSYEEKRRPIKGKMREGIDSINVNDSGIDIVARGASYHVPLSAYPVGSTAMTTGGFGYLCRAYGLSLDNLVEVEMVLADGQVVVLNESSKNATEKEANLWWAVRGAAPCFGVVTRLIAKAYPLPRVYAGNLIFPFNPITAPSLLRHWRDCLKGTGDQIPHELYSNLILTAGPPSGARESVIVIQVCFLGTSATDDIGNSFVQAISSWTGERVLLKDVTEKSFLDQQDGVAQVLKSGNDRRWMTRGDLISTLTDEAIYKTVDKFHQMGPNRAVWIFELIGGAIEDTKDTCISPLQRSAKFTVAALQQWSDADDDEKCVKSVEGWVQEVLSEISLGGPFPCFLERFETKKRVEGSFGKENLARLVEIKKQVDPSGLFRHTFAGGLTDYM